MKLQKDLYRYLKSDLPFNKKHLGYLKPEGFGINPSDTTANRKKDAITSPMDNMKISHTSANGLTTMINWLKSIYKKEMKV